MVEVATRLQLDHETQINPLPWSNSGTVIGAAYEIVNNRTRLTPYRTVELDSSLDVFRLVSDITVVLPNEAIEDSLARMRLLGLGEATFAERAHFSRPSNVMFIPAEFRFINCNVSHVKVLDLVLTQSLYLRMAQKPIWNCLGRNVVGPVVVDLHAPAPNFRPKRKDGSGRCPTPKMVNKALQYSVPQIIRLVPAVSLDPWE